jgi:hypothetical protein
MSKRQATVALSSTEAEYIAASIATQEAIYLTTLLKDLCHPIDGPMTIYQDNQGAIALEKNPVGHRRMKHIDIRYYFVRERVEDGQITFKYVPTNDMAADSLTKPVPGPTMNRHLSILFGENARRQENSFVRESVENRALISYLGTGDRMSTCVKSIHGNGFPATIQRSPR